MQPKIRTVVSAKTIVHFCVERSENGTIISRYESGEMVAVRYSHKGFDDCVSDMREEIKFFEKNPLTRIYPDSLSRLRVAA